MKIASKLAVALMLALIAVPSFSTTVTYAQDNDSCDLEDRDSDECKREKPRLQTRFFDE